jgi:hypothetical protein
MFAGWKFAGAVTVGAGGLCWAAGGGEGAGTDVAVALGCAPPPPLQAAIDNGHTIQHAITRRKLFFIFSLRCLQMRHPYFAPKLPSQAFPLPETCHTPTVSCAAEP